MRTPALAAVAAFSSVSLIACNNGFGSSFEGDIVMRTTRPNTPPSELTIKAKGDKLRFEMPTPDGKTANALFLPQENKLVFLIDKQKTAMDMDLSAPSAPTPNTDARTSDVQKSGKKETVAGLDCENYVVKDPSGRRTETCMAQGLAYFDLNSIRSGGGTSWSRDMQAKKMFPLRSVEYDAAGTELSRAEVTSVKKGKLDDALFAVPAGYTRVAAPPH